MMGPLITFEFFTSFAYTLPMMNPLQKHVSTLSLISTILLFLTACSSIVSSTASKMAENLSYSILNSDDPKTVADGAPAYLLLMDSFLIDSENNPKLLQSGATLYGAYSSIFVSDPARAKKMSNKALNYAEQALCLSDKKFCDIRQLDFQSFSKLMIEVNKNNMSSWYVLGTTWAGWIKAHSGSMAAVAELPRVTLIMTRIVELDDGWKNGQAHLYLGVLNTLLPPAFGGKPEKGQYHFKHSIQLTNGKDLTAKVLYAEKYARLMFEQELHDKLLQDVIKADPYFKNLTLMNILAQEKAKELLATSPDYF